MKAKRVLSLLLSLVMVLGLIVVPVYADGDNEITAYVNFSQNGQIATDKTGKALVLAPVTLTGKDGYTLDDVFRAFHDTYYDGGSEAGYKTAASDWGGEYVSKLWGDESANFGYQINAGAVDVSGPARAVSDKDVIDAVIYKNSWPDTENYAAFDCYEKEVESGRGFTLTLNETSYDEEFNKVVSGCAGAKITVDGASTKYKTDDSGSVKLSFDKAGTYIISAVKEKVVDESSVPAITPPVCVVTVKKLTATVSAPSDATVFVGTKGTAHYVPFIEVASTSVSESEGVKTYSYELENNAQYNYRVTKSGAVTVGGIFKATPDLKLEITDEAFAPAGKTASTVDRDKASNTGYNVGDIYLNINPAGWLKLSTDDTYQIVSFRNWEPVNTLTGNYFLEPDFHFEATDLTGGATDVITVSDKGLITANKSGTAIVKVTYDAINLNYGKGYDFYGAIWPENTGVFVVSVDSEAASDTGMKIHVGKNSTALKLAGDSLDAEHDVIYFTGTSGEYSFAPDYEASVYVANPTVGTTLDYSGFTEVLKKEDGSFLIPLTEGRNIVKVTADGKDMYQVITAKKVSYTVNGGDAVNPGDKISIVFDTLYSPSGKLSALYNYSASIVYENVSGYDGETAGGLSASHKFASEAKGQTVAYLVEKKEAWGSVSYAKKAELKVPEDFTGTTFTLSDGYIFVGGWGEPIGTHRTVDYETGRTPKKESPGIYVALSRLPDIEIPITALPPIEGITLNTDKVKKEYFAGDSFNKSGLTVTANYEGGISKTVEGYSVSPEVLTADTTKVTVSYKGKTAEIPVTVTVAKVTAIEITTPPTKTEYTEGEIFSPSGMVITATLENGKTRTTTDYTYTPYRELLSTDDGIDISYTGADKEEGIASVRQTIKVNEGGTGGGSGNGNIWVYFTLLGDSVHGDPETSGKKHTLKAGNLEEWIPQTKITVKKGSCVLDVLKKALSLKGIQYTNDPVSGNYISEIKGLSEMDNGELSGWMYTLNRHYSDEGVSEQKVNAGDEIVFHYTDDYTVEETDFSSSSSSSGGSRPKKDTVAEKPEKPAEDEEKKDEEKNTLTEPSFDEATYPDVKKDEWYFDAVKYAYQKGIMKGTDKGFEPLGTLTRAMVITILHRLANEPSVDFALLFEDVADGAWYTEAVRWGASYGIVSGVTEKSFDAEGAISREQLVTMLYRFAEKTDTVKNKGDGAESFSDGAAVSSYAVEAVEWAITNGILKGDGEGKLNPAAPVTRAEAAAIFMRYCEGITK